MKNSNLVPTPIVNVNGVATVVYRKPATTTTSALPATPARPAEALTSKALITKAALALGTSKDTAHRLGQKSEELDTDARVALLSLMKQDDPNGTAKTMLPTSSAKSSPRTRTPTLASSQHGSSTLTNISTL